MRTVLTGNNKGASQSIGSVPETFVWFAQERGGSKKKRGYHNASSRHLRLSHWLSFIFNILWYDRVLRSLTDIKKRKKNNE